ncbi:sugar ABC transporter substrate-binding protein [Brachybacterium endophyticum]|uniref:Sugar ABC transporter substrate-binding protein n=1 Tax=Brachybacterium endophyticum TaxID=2182385 RepID=A0A2U2RMY4_9MICO|nr:extracellular solute-binding protein [Brachybacterium endophyticum]PWH07230.1 sugar ABC transporter substrate-binding protein [Brachybacterium endophyticum]
MKTLTRRTLGAAALTLPLALSACGRSAVDARAASTSRGPISIWISTNEQELAWGKAVAKAWNAQHGDQEVTVQEIPAGSSSEEAITAAIVAGTTPDLIFNISPAALPDWVRAGGLVDLTTFEGAREHIESRGGSRARNYAEDEGRGGYYQLPWKSNPVMLMYNRKIFEKAGLDADHPGLDTFDAFLDASRQIVSSGASGSAIWPTPTSDFYQPWSDFYPLYLAQTHGTRLIEDGRTTFDSPDGLAVARMWRTMYEEELAPREQSTDDAMTTGATAMQLAGPYAIATYEDAIDYGFMPVPTVDGIPAAKTITYADSKNVSLCSTSRNRLTAWDFLAFATGEEWDGKLLETTGQMPLREDLTSTYPDYFEKNPDYTSFADQADRVADVPYVSGGIEIWQRFRDAYSGAVIFGKDSVTDAFAEVSRQIDALVKE